MKLDITTATAATAITLKNVKSIVTNIDAAVSASDTAWKIAVKWMIKHPTDLKDLIATSTDAMVVALATLIAAAPSATSARMDADHHTWADAQALIMHAKNIDADVVDIIAKNKDVDMLVDNISMIFWLPDKLTSADIKAAKTAMNNV